MVGSKIWEDTCGLPKRGLGPWKRGYSPEADSGGVPRKDTVGPAGVSDGRHLGGTRGGEPLSTNTGPGMSLKVTQKGRRLSGQASKTNAETNTSEEKGGSSGISEGRGCSQGEM